MDGMKEEIERLGRRQCEWLRDAGCEIVDVSCATQLRCRLLHHRRRRRRVQPARYDECPFGHRAAASPLTAGTRTQRRSRDEQAPRVIGHVLSRA